MSKASMRTEFSACHFIYIMMEGYFSPALALILNVVLPLYIHPCDVGNQRIPSCREAATGVVQQGSHREGDRIIPGSHSLAGMARITITMHKGNHKPDKYIH